MSALVRRYDPKSVKLYYGFWQFAGFANTDKLMDSIKNKWETCDFTAI